MNRRLSSNSTMSSLSVDGVWNLIYGYLLFERIVHRLIRGVVRRTTIHTKASVSAAKPNKRLKGRGRKTTVKRKSPMFTRPKTKIFISLFLIFMVPSLISVGRSLSSQFDMLDSLCEFDRTSSFRLLLAAKDMESQLVAQ